MTIYKPVRSLERGLAVLRAANTLAEPSVEAIAKEAGLSWSTAFRLLETLERAGYVYRHETARTFRPTLAARALGDGFTPDTWIAQIASPEIGKLSRKIVWPVDLMVFSADAMLIVETTHRSSPLSIDRNMIGRRLPVLGTSAGRCYLGHLAPRKRAALMRRLSLRQDSDGESARQTKVVEAMLRRVREDGFGTREGGLFPHTRSIAVPIRQGPEVVACVSVIWMTSTLGLAEGIRRFLPPLRDCVATIEQKLPKKPPSAGRTRKS